MKKLEKIRCTALGTYLKNPNVPQDEKASFTLQVSTKELASASSDVSSSDWVNVESYVTSINPIVEQPLTSDTLTKILQVNSKKEVTIRVDDNIKSYRVLATCARCPVTSSFPAASGSFPVISD